MALTREQFIALRKKGLSVDQIVAFEGGATPSVTKQTIGNQFAQPVTKTDTSRMGFGDKYDPEKVRNLTNIIGGGKLAEGLGMGLAARSVQKGLTEAEQMQSDTALLLVKQINKAKKEGRDTTRLDNALKELQGSQKVSRDAQEDFTKALPTTKEVLGSSLKLVTTFAGGRIASLGAKATALGKATGIMSGALRGTGAGAISGGIGGGLFGVGEGLEENKGAKDVAVSGLVGAGLGVVIGAPLGAITGGIGGFIRGKQATSENFAEDLVSAKQTTKEKIEGIRQGRLEDPTLFKKAELQYSKRDKELADAVREVVSPKASLGENIDSLRLYVNQTNNGVKGYIQTHKVPFNTNQLKSQLMTGKGELELVFASDASAEKTYEKVVEAFINNVDKGDTLGLFEGRQTFDQLPAVQKLLNSSALGENSRKEIVLAVRKMANDYIASLLPQGSIYKQAMLNEHLWLEALGNIAEKNVNIIGKNNLQILTQQYPILKWLVGGIGLGLAGELLRGGVGVGGSVIGSTD